MQKFIHDDFVLDLSGYQINRVEENQWFSDQFFTKYTFPFDLRLTDEINTYFGAIAEYNIAEPRTYYKGYLFIDGGHEAAVLEIKEIKERIATVEISYGFDNLPSFDKKLSELPLQKENLAVSLFEHAEGIIAQTWPAVNYNFVQVHTDSFNPEDERWTGFEKIINNYKDGAFLLNEFDDEENITYNRNIMIPMPYFLHVLTKGFLDAGFTLKGDILEDAEIKKMLFFKETEEYVNARIEGEEVMARTGDSVLTYSYTWEYGVWPFKKSVTSTLGKYLYTHTFPKKGKYKISGNIYLRRENSDAWVKIFFNGAEIEFRRDDLITKGGYTEHIKSFDFDVYVNNLAQQMVIDSRQINYGYINDLVSTDLPVIDLTITPLAIYNESNELIPPLITTTRLDLTKCVPDTTFGDFVKAIKNWKNMDLRVIGREVHMNYIEPQMSVRDAIDLNKFNLKSPRRKFSQGNSFLLQFRELDNENYKPAPVFVDIDGYKVNGYTVNDQTTEITINVVPLPNVFRGSVTTALAVDKGESNICVVLYAGAPSILNVAENNTNILLPYIYENFWKKWLNFRIKSQSFVTDFKAQGMDIRDLNVFSKVFMYNNYFLLRSINKTNIPGKEIFVVELEMDNLK